MTTAADFDRYVGIDYSGAETPVTSLNGLRVYVSDRTGPPIEVRPASRSGRHWTRRGVAEWLAGRLSEDRPTLVGIDHGFSFPLEYFERHGLAHDWPAFLDDFWRHWPTDGDEASVQGFRSGQARSGAARWRRLAERRAGGAKSVFHFDVPGSVAKSTHSGLPWLRYLRQHVGDRVCFWPFDGWAVSAGRSAIVEVYPSLWSRSFAREDRTRDQHDAYSVAAWLRGADADGSLAGFFDPVLTPAERAAAEIEGWILGVR